MPTGFCCHVFGKTLRNVCYLTYCTLLYRHFFKNQVIPFYLRNTFSLDLSLCLTDLQYGDRIVTVDYCHITLPHILNYHKSCVFPCRWLRVLEAQHAWLSLACRPSRTALSCLCLLYCSATLAKIHRRKLSSSMVISMSNRQKRSRLQKFCG